MRSRSPQRNRAPAKRHSSKQRSRSGSTTGRKKEDREARRRNEDPPHRGGGRGQKEPPRKREFGIKHHNRRHNKDSPDSDEDQKDVAQKVGSRRRSRSPDHAKRRSRSKSDDRKRSKDARHAKKRTRHGGAKSVDTGGGAAKNAPRHSRKRTGSEKRSRSPPEPKRKARESNALDEQQMPGRPEAGDSWFGNRKQQQPAKKKSDQTRLTLNDRFSQFHDNKPIVLDESISIEIERNIDGDEPFVIPNFHPHEVRLPRRSDEGRRSLTTRVEFASRHDDDDAEVEEGYAEKRVVTVMKSRSRESASDTVWHRLGGQGGSRGMSEAPPSRLLPTLFWKDVGRETVIQVPIITSDRGRDADSSEVTSANDRLGRRVVQTRSDPEVRRSDGAAESQFRNRRRFPGSREDADSRQVEGQHDQEARLFRGSNRRFDPQGRRRLADKFRGKVTSSVKPMGREMRNNQREDDKNQPDELPDFSRRPDKYSYDSWMDKPEMIPRGRSYFEHDNRNEDMPWVVNRGRGGRGGFVRGGGRGGGGGRGFGGRGAMPRFQNNVGGFRKRSRSVESVEWKHDKFETLEDEKPTSTTEK